MTWDEFDYWRSGEFQVVEERLKDLKKARKSFNPAKENLFAALDAVDFDTVKVAIIGQDPYPDAKYATGIAFSIPKDAKGFPPTLANILQEYCTDLNHPYPNNGDLTKWCEQGVLLWNAYPSCTTGEAGSHDWVEWDLLTEEIITELDTERKVVFVFLGTRARAFEKFVKNGKTLSFSHPSPRASRMAKHPFLGSRMFSTINVKLVELKQSPVDWRL